MPSFDNQKNENTVLMKKKKNYWAIVKQINNVKLFYASKYLDMLELNLVTIKPNVREKNKTFKKL